VMWVIPHISTGNHKMMEMRLENVTSP